MLDRVLRGRIGFLQPGRSSLSACTENLDGACLHTDKTGATGTRGVARKLLLAVLMPSHIAMPRLTSKVSLWVGDQSSK